MTNTRGVQSFRENDLRSLGWFTSKTSCESDYPISCVHVLRATYRGVCQQNKSSDSSSNNFQCSGVDDKEEWGYKVRTDVIRKYLRTYFIYVPKDALAGKDWKWSLNYLWCYVSSQFFHKNVGLE